MTMLALGYASKKDLKAAIGKPLNYRETSLFGEEFKRDGVNVVAHRPAITGGKGREFFAKVTTKEGKIFKVE